MSFETLVTAIIQREGGYSNDLRDSGGETNHGITIKLARAYGYMGPMRDMAVPQAKAIYRAAFWDVMKLDPIEQVMPTVADELFDSGVNLGVQRAGMWLQRSLNVFNQNSRLYKDIPVDGVIGMLTVASLSDYLRGRAKDGEVVLLRALNGLQTAFYIELAEKREKDEAFVFGWIRTRVL